jgi:hypothetical protein
LIETPAAGLVRMFKKVINENDKRTTCTKAAVVER